MSTKFYAVKKGLTPGIYTTWEECKNQVHQYSGAVYKSFKTLDEAKAFLDDSAPNAISDSDDVAIAYVDGSYNSSTHQFSYGVVLMYKGKEYTLSQMVDDPTQASMRNVAGEIAGSKAAISLAIELKCPKIIIHHDYEGISKWCLGEWEAKKPGTIEYREFYKKALQTIAIEFVKVKGHSNNKYNDMADELAKQAIFE